MMKTLTASALAAFAGSASAQTFDSDTLSGSASVDASGGISVSAFGLTLASGSDDDLNVDQDLDLGGSAQIRTTFAGDGTLATLGFNELLLTLEDGSESVSFAASDSILFDLAGASISLNASLSFSDVALTLLNPTADATVNPITGEVELINPEFDISGGVEFSLDFEVTGAGLASGLNDQIPSISLTEQDLGAAPGQPLFISETVALPSIVLDSSLVGDQLTLSDVQLFDDVALDAILLDQVGLTFPITDLNALLAIAADLGVDTSGFSDFTDLIGDFFLDLSFEAQTSLTATFTIPTPGVAGLTIAAGLFAARRRRV